MPRRLAAALLVLVAVAAVVSTALVPRGLVRAAAAQHLPLAPSGEHAELGAPAYDVHLPGVRAVVGKEEEDGASGLQRDPSAAPPPTVAVPGPADALPADTAAAPSSPTGSLVGEPALGRAPPETV